MAATSSARVRRCIALLVMTACSSTTPVAQPTQTSSPTPAPTFTPVRAVFSAARALASIRELAALGPREAASATYLRAATVTANHLVAQGYRVRTQWFDVRSGYISTEPGGRRTPVRAGTTRNVIAEPPGFDPLKPFVVVGGHLDTVPGSPGANDNASGIGVMLELARMTRVEPPRLPIVFVAFGAEERRRQSESESQYAQGSTEYLESLTNAQRGNVRAAMILDMIGAGSRVKILGRGDIKELALATARRLRIPAGFETTFLFSDHLPFEQRDIPVVWFWAGDHRSFHSPADTVSVIERAEITRVGRVAWATLRALR